jgi:hypothetical protein
VLSGSGGVADMVSELIPHINKNTGAHVLYDDNPASLVDRLVHYYRTTHYRLPNALHDLPSTPSTARSSTV